MKRGKLLFVLAFSFLPRRSIVDTPASRGGFTLLELLVSMSVAILLIVLLLQVFSSSTTNWQRGENRTDTYREARAALQLMGRDLSQTIQPVPTPVPSTSPTPGPTPSVGATMPTLVLERSPKLVPAETYPFEQAYCLTASSNNGGASDLCAVGYYCQWNDHKHAYILMRQFANSDTTYNLISLAHANQPITFFDLFTPASGTPLTTTTDIASYIWDLQFRVDTSLKTVYSTVGDPPPAPPPPTSSTSPGRSYGIDPPYAEHLPPFIEIRFKAMSTGAAKIIESNASITRDVWSNPSNALYQQFIAPSAQQFSARLPLTNSGAIAATPPPTP